MNTEIRNENISPSTSDNMATKIFDNNDIQCATDLTMKYAKTIRNCELINFVKHEAKYQIGNDDFEPIDGGTMKADCNNYQLPISNNVNVNHSLLSESGKLTKSKNFKSVNKKPDTKNETVSPLTSDSGTKPFDSDETYSATDLTVKYYGKALNDCESINFVKHESKYQINTNEFEAVDGTLKTDGNNFQLQISNSSTINHSSMVSDSVKLTKSKNLKSGNKKSFVWKYFSHPKNVDGIEDRSRTECLECKSQLAFNASGTTTTMLNHLKSRHPKIAECEEYIKLRNSQITGSIEPTKPQNHCPSNESPTAALSPSISLELSKTNHSSPENKSSEVNLYSLFPNNNNTNNNPENYVDSTRLLCLTKLISKPIVMTTSSTQPNSNSNFLNNFNSSLNISENNNVTNNKFINTNVNNNNIINNNNNISNYQFSPNRSAVKRKRKKPICIQSSNQLNINGSQNCSQKQLKSDSQTRMESGDLTLIPNINSINQNNTNLNDIICSNFISSDSKSSIYNDNNNNSSTPPFLHLKTQMYPEFNKPKRPFNSMFLKNNVMDSDKIIVYWLIKDLRPYSILEETGMKLLFSSLMPSVTIPSISHLRNEVVPSIYWALKSEILNDLASVGGAGFSIELWDNENNGSIYASMKLHYYSKTDMTLRCKMLKTKEIGAKHLCSDLLMSCCNEIGLDLSSIQFLPVVMNNPETMRDELDNVGEIEQNKKFIIIPCLMSSLQEVAKFGFEEPEVVKLLDKCRALKELAKAYNIVLDSCNFNLSSLCKVSNYPCEKFELIYWVYSNLDQILDKLDCYNSDRFNKEDEIFLKQLTPLLEHIYQTLKVIEQNKLFFSASMIKSIILTMNKSPFQPKDDDHDGVIQFKIAVKKRLNKIYPNSGKLHEILWIAAFLDPRFKKYHEQFTPDETQMIQIIRNQIKNVNEISNELFEDVQPVIKREELHTIFGDDCLSQETKSEVDLYLTEHKIDIEKHPIKWWQDNSSRFPTLSKLALKYLCIPLANHDDVESSGSESIIYTRRKELDPDEIDNYLFLNHNWN